MPYTRGFADRLLLEEHFADKGESLGVSTKEDYLRLADEFLGSAPKVTTIECTDRKGDKIRGDLATEEFGVLSRSGFIRTYYKANIRNRRKYPTLREYVMEKCRR